MSRPTPEQIRAAGKKAMQKMRDDFGPSANADVIDIAEQRRRNALYVLGILLRAYVPKNTNDWSEMEAALKALAAGVAGVQPQQAVQCAFCERPMIAGSECLTADRAAACEVRTTGAREVDRG